LHAQKAVQPARGAPGTWQLIGRTQADHSVDHDTIFVRGSFDNFRRIKSKLIGRTQADHSVDHDTIFVRGPFDNFRRIKSNIVPARWNEGITVKRFEAIS